jgi:hypothetical protein
MFQTVIYTYDDNYSDPNQITTIEGRAIILKLESTSCLTKF